MSRLHAPFSGLFIGFKVKVKYTLFNLRVGMVTYSYERQDIIQFALKRLLGG
jgi:hypothetical protein